MARVWHTLVATKKLVCDAEVNFTLVSMGDDATCSHSMLKGRSDNKPRKCIESVYTEKGNVKKLSCSSKNINMQGSLIITISYT